MLNLDKSPWDYDSLSLMRDNDQLPRMRLLLVSLMFLGCHPHPGPESHGTTTDGTAMTDNSSTNGESTTESTETGDSSEGPTTAENGCGDGVPAPDEWCHELTIVSDIQILQRPGAGDIDDDGSTEAIVWGIEGIWTLDESLLPTWIAPAPFPPTGRIQIGDFEGDGWADVFLQGPEIFGVIHNSNGTLDSVVEEFSIAEYAIQKIEVVDVDGDGKSEYFGLYSNDAFLHAQIDGQLVAVQTLPELIPCGWVEDIRSGHFNDDEFEDLAILPAGCGDQASKPVLILKGVDDGTLTGLEQYPSGEGESGLDIGDINGDGWQDIVTINPTSNEINVLIGKGNGGFEDPVRFTIDTQGIHATIGNFDAAEGEEIIYQGGGELHVYRPFDEWHKTISGLGYWMQDTDLNNDGVSDLVFGMSGDLSVDLAILISNP